MGTFFTSDWHLGHANIIRYCDRPFVTVHEMHAGLAAAWQAQVSEGDTVWILGDLSMGSLRDALRFFGDLPGTKHVVSGNHDPFFAGRRRAASHLRRVQASSVFASVQMNTEMHIGEHLVNVSHFPYIGDSGKHDRYVEARLTDDGRWIVHGHVHEKWKQRRHQINVGIDAWGGRLVPEDELVHLIDAGPCDRDIDPWTHPLH